MKIRTTFIGAAMCAMLAACSSAPDTTERAEQIQKKAEELGKFVVPIYAQIGNHDDHVELDVMTCPDLHQGDIPISQMCHGTGDLADVLVLVRNGNRVVNVIVEDRPGGGCIHVDIAGLKAGYTIQVLAIVKDAPGANPYSVARTELTVPGGLNGT